MFCHAAWSRPRRFALFFTGRGGIGRHGWTPARGPAGFTHLRPVTWRCITPTACPRGSGGRPGPHDGEEGNAPPEDPLPRGEGRVRGRFRLRRREAGLGPRLRGDDETGTKARVARPTGAPHTGRNEMCASGRLGGRGDDGGGRHRFLSTTADITPLASTRTKGCACIPDSCGMSCSVMFAMPLPKLCRSVPAYRSSIAFRSPRRQPAHPAGPFLRAYRACAPAPARARLALARFAHLIARARRRTHFSRWQNRGLFSRRRERRNEAAPRAPPPSSRRPL